MLVLLRAEYEKERRQLFLHKKGLFWDFSIIEVIKFDYNLFDCLTLEVPKMMINSRLVTLFKTLVFPSIETTLRGISSLHLIIYTKQ